MPKLLIEGVRNVYFYTEHVAQTHMFYEPNGTGMKALCCQTFETEILNNYAALSLRRWRTRRSPEISKELDFKKTC